MREKIRILTLFSMLLLSTTASTLIVKPVNANAIPMPYTKIMMISPQNTTYNSNTILLSVNVDTTYSCRLFYSIDGQSMHPIENVTVISSENVNAGKNPAIYRTVLNASISVNVSVGKHNITVIHVNPNTKYEVGYSTTVFQIDSTSNIPEFDSWVVFPLFLVATFFVVVVKKVSGLKK